MSNELKIGDLVWAKMKGFFPWPARICKPGPNAKKTEKKGHHWVYFFGSYDYSWIGEACIKPYLQYKEKFAKNCKAPKFKKAVEDIEEFIARKKDDPSYEIEPPQETPESEDDKFNKLVSPAPAKKPRKSATKSISEGSGSASKATPKKPLNTSATKRSISESSSSASKPTPKRSKVSDKSNKGEPENGLSPYSRTDLLDNEGEAMDMNDFSELLKTKNVTPSNLVFGFLGVGVIGSGVVKNLINSGHRVNLWSRNTSKCEEIKSKAEENRPGLVKTYEVPYEVVRNSDIIFCCVTDPQTAKIVIHGNCGVLYSAEDGDGFKGKGYVEMTGVDPETSKDNWEIITSKGGRYLEAQVQGSKDEADDGSLVVLTSGDQSLFLDCQSCFKAMGKTAFFLGDVGYATKVNLILHLVKGIALVGLAEGLALADRCGISSKDLLKIFSLTNVASPYLKKKADKMVTKDFSNCEHALQHLQKDMKLVLDLSDRLKQPLLMASTANEVFKHARRLGYDDHDVSCIYMRTRH